MLKYSTNGPTRAANAAKTFTFPLTTAKTAAEALASKKRKATTVSTKKKVQYSLPSGPKNAFSRVFI